MSLALSFKAGKMSPRVIPRRVQRRLNPFSTVAAATRANSSGIPGEIGEAGLVRLPRFFVAFSLQQIVLPVFRDADARHLRAGFINYVHAPTRHCRGLEREKENDEEKNKAPASQARQRFGNSEILPNNVNAD